MFAETLLPLLLSAVIVAASTTDVRFNLVLDGHDCTRARKNIDDMNNGAPYYLANVIRIRKCVSQDKPWLTCSWVCEFRASDVTNTEQLRALEEAYGNSPANRESFQRAVRLVSEAEDVNGTTSFDIAVVCPSYTDAAGVTRNLPTCARWRRLDKDGAYLRKAIARYFTPEEQIEFRRLGSKFCESVAGQTHPDCRCLNRANDTEYKAVANFDPSLGDAANCWFYPCTSGEAIPDPDLGKANCSTDVYNSLKQAIKKRGDAILSEESTNDESSSSSQPTAFGVATLLGVAALVAVYVRRT